MPDDHRISSNNDDGGIGDSRKHRANQKQNRSTMFCFQTHLGSSVHAPPQCVFYFTYILIIYIIKNNAAITREMFNFDGGTKDWRKIAHWRCCRMYQAYKFECNATSALVRANGDGSDNICNIATTRKQTNNTKNAINKCRGGDSRKHPGSPEIFRSNTWYLVNFACIQRSCTCEQLRCSFFYSFFCSLLSLRCCA